MPYQFNPITGQLDLVGSSTTTDIAATTHAATSKATPVDADELPLVDSAAANVLKKLTWANLKATVKAYTDTLYPSGSGTSSGTNTGDQTSVSGNAGTATTLQTSRNIDGQAFNGSADITVIAPGTHAATSKATPADADELSLVDSAASNVLKKLTWANAKATLKTYFDTLYPSGSGTSTGTNTGDQTVPAFAANAVALGTAAAAGAASTVMRTDDTIAAFDATVPTTQAFGDAAATGSAAKAARRDHKHAMPSFATNAVTLGAAAAAGVATTPFRSDDTIAAFDATVPTTQAFGDAAAVGTAAFAARRDHKHAMPATPVTSLAKSGSSAITGAATLTAGTNITLTQSANDITIAAPYIGFAIIGIP